MKITLNVKSKDSKVKDILEIYDDTLIKVTDEKNRVVYKGIVDYAPKEIRDGRWHKGANNKTFTINSERGVLTVKVLDSSVRDSLQLKTYKIKNHDSGKTYSVKAVSYADAVKRYNKHILKDATVTYIENYKGVKIYQNDDNKKYFATVYIYSLEDKDLKTLKAKIDKALNEHIKKYKNLDSLTEDAYVYPTNASTSMALSFAKLCVEKFGGKIASRNGNKYVYVAPDKNTAEKAKRFLETEYSSITFIVKDALTEDADDDITYKGYLILTEYQLGSKNITQYKIYEPDGNYLFAVKTLEQAKRVIDNEVKHRMNDADIAQTDIKSTYLPEDANADNIQYLGFNEKRKLSFYSYGDRYFVYHDLEGRTEEIDKETVQKILKKNILGEIDENDLINKEPQSEEIVTDRKKKQESGDR